MSPSVGALGVGLHLALAHHDGLEGHSHHDGLEGHEDDSGEHNLEISQLARAAAHGHHHDAEAAPDHDHDAIADGSAPTLRPNASTAEVLPVAAAFEVIFVERSLRGSSPRRGPPLPLFTANCSLLL